MKSGMERAVTFSCGTDQCLGILHYANQRQSTVGLLVVVGGPQYRVGSHRQFVCLARYLAAQGHSVLRFDYRGMGDSSGDYRDFRSIGDDLRCAVDALMQAEPALRSVVLFGLCDAAAAAMMYCSSDDRVAGLILANPWVRSESGLARAHVKHYYRRRILQGSFWTKLRSGRYRIAPSLKSFLRSVVVALRDQAAAAGGGGGGGVDFVTMMRLGFEGFSGPSLFLISGRDLTANEFSDLCERRPEWGRLVARQNVVIRRMTEADHTFSTRASADWVNETCAKWLAEISRSGDVPGNGVRVKG
jgi:exosortase A-associated hydrolase 1